MLDLAPASLGLHSTAIYINNLVKTAFLVHLSAKIWLKIALSATAARFLH